MLVRTTISTCVVALACAPAAAASGQSTGGTAYGPRPVAGGDNGGTAYGSPPIRRPARHTTPQRRRSHRHAGGGGPVAADFGLATRTAYAYGAPARVHFRINARASRIDVRLVFVHIRSRKRKLVVDLGRQPTGREVQVAWRGTTLPEGRYRVLLRAGDRRGRRLRAGAHAATAAPLAFYSARFPLLGPHNFGGPDARFGAPRKGHRHQGQDVAAAAGTPIVAPRGGTVTTRSYQAGGAGYYLVIRGDGTDRSYVFMHLRTGSILVHEGDHVITGQPLAQVGSTGASSGPHLHFEIWEGPWYAGGHPIDPLPSLLRWDSYS